MSDIEKLTKAADKISRANEVMGKLLKSMKDYTKPIVSTEIKGDHIKDVDNIINHVPNSKYAAEAIKIYATRKELDLGALVKGYMEKHMLEEAIEVNKPSRQKGKFDARERRFEDLGANLSSNTSPNDLLAAMAAVSPVAMPQNRAEQVRKLAHLS